MAPADVKDTHDEDDDNEDDSLYTPALPPDLQAPKRTLGPAMPPPAPARDDFPSDGAAEAEDEDEEVGPMPAPAPTSPRTPADDAVREFMAREERRRRARAGEDDAASRPLQREEWMLVPPSASGVLGSLDPTRLKPRQFARGRGAAAATDADARDGSLWTETPAERQTRLADEVSGKRRRATDAPPDADDADEEHANGNRSKRHKHGHEAAVRSQVEAYNRQTRGQSLVDIHQSSDGKPKKDQGLSDVWDHARDMSVGGRLMDEAQRSKMIRDARTLNDRFGKSKDGGFL